MDLQWSIDAALTLLRSFARLYVRDHTVAGSLIFPDDVTDTLANHIKEGRFIESLSLDLYPIEQVAVFEFSMECCEIDGSVRFNDTLDESELDQFAECFATIMKSKAVGVVDDVSEIKREIIGRFKTALENPDSCVELTITNTRGRQNAPSTRTLQ